MEQQTITEEKLREFARRLAEAAREVFGLDEEFSQDLTDIFRMSIEMNLKLREMGKQIECLKESSQTKFVIRKENEIIPLLTSTDEGWLVEKRTLRSDEMIYALIAALWEVLLRRKVEKVMIRGGVGA
ncbi:MAG: hypothetical protein J7J01_00975 [Methanophagales archaeon]|nr:hypothetical protein [Methanophagales archaeon]